MNGPGDIPLTTLSSTPDTRPCSLISIIPALGMSSCRGRAEAFARRLSSKLRTLGSQTDDDPTSQEDEPIINGGSANTWMSGHDTEHTVTDLQPLRHESDSFFDFDCELESPGSPVDECEYLRLIETASNTPHNSAAESGYVCASAASSHSSTDYYDVATSGDNTTTSTTSMPTGSQQQQQQTTIPTTTTPPSSPQNSAIVEPEVNGSLLGIDEHDFGMGNTNNNNNNNVTHNWECTDEVTVPATLPSTCADAESHVKSTNTVVAVEATEAMDVELSAENNARMQQDIISELQKQSENYTSASCSTQTGCEDDADAAEPKQPELQHTITNGHAEDGDEVLKIVVTEVEEKLETVTAPTETPSVETPAEKAPEVAAPEESSVETSKTVVPAKQSGQNSQLHDTTDDEDDCRPQRVRRCSSLKTGKTPPGTPGRKKIVRFADVLGLDLADVKTFLDEIPTIPKSAFEDLEILDAEPPMQLGPKSDKLLMPLFQQPGGLATFLDLVREKQVSLENAAVTDTINQTITGSVRVRNLDFNKSVHIRYTLDGWRSFADLQANYVENSCDGFSDKFSFVIFGNTLQIGQRLELAVRFQCKGQQFWDNNYGTNYCFQCLPTSNPITNPIAPIVPSHHQGQLVGMLSPTAGDAWCSSFY